MHNRTVAAHVLVQRRSGETKTPCCCEITVAWGAKRIQWVPKQ